MRFALPFSNPFPWQKPPLGARIDWNNPLTRGLVGCWVMNENTGSLVNDLGTRRNDGTRNGATWQGGTLFFDGSSGNVDCGNIDYLNGIEELTIVTLVKPLSLTSDNTIVAKDEWGTTMQLCLWRDNEGYESGRTDIYTVLVSNGSSSVRIEGAPHPDTIAHQVAFTYGDNLRLYVDSKEDPYSPVTGIGALESNSFSFLIGEAAGTSGTPKNTFHGYIFYCYIWNRILQPSEIRFLYSYPYAFFLWPGLEWWVAPTGEGQVFSVTLQDSLGLSDSRGTVQDKVMAESLALSDRKWKELEKHLLDSLSLSDTHFKSCLFHRLFTDVVTLTDVAIKTLDKALQDQLDISDRLVKTLNKIFATSITLTDTFIAEIISGVVEKVFQDTLLLSDLKKIDLDKKITDMLSLSDIKRMDLDKKVADTLSLSDARRVDLDKKVRDSLLLSDIRKLDLDKRLADTLPLSDTYIAQIAGILTKVLVDSLILTDRSKKELFKSFFDTLPVEDTIKTQVIFTKLLTDTLLQLQDRRKKEIEKTIAESVALNDRFTKEELKILTDTLTQLSDSLNAQIVWAVVKVITTMFTDIKDLYGMEKDIKDPYGMKGS